MIKQVYGDIRDAKEDLICQQVNCRGVMGAGVARAIYERWPEVKTEYKKFCSDFSDPKDILGSILWTNVAPDKKVICVFGQLDYGRDPHKRYTDYKALTNAFNLIRKTYPDKSIAFPYGFGCGLANGDWGIVSKIIEIYFSDMDVTIYRLPPTAA